MNHRALGQGLDDTTSIWQGVRLSLFTETMRGIDKI